MEEALFELRGPDGQVWRLFENGNVEGFPDGTTVMNQARPLFDALRGKALCAQMRPCETEAVSELVTT